MLRQPAFSSRAKVSFRARFFHFTRFASLAVLLAITSAAIPASGQQSDDDKQAYDLQAIAANAQNAKDYEVARKKWQQLLDEFPESPAARSAWYHLGNCSYNLEDYENAIPAFKKALPELQEDQSPAVPEVLLALGYSRIREGERLAKTDPDESASQFTTAANDLNTILLKHKDSLLVGSAAFQRGKALEALGQRDAAKQAYEQSVDFKDNEFRVNAMYALGRLSLGDNDFDNAARWYDRIRTIVDKKKGHALLDSANLNYADALMNIGLGTDDSEAAAKNFTESKAILAEVIKNKNFDARDSALFMNASCSMYLADNAGAAQQFQQVADIKDSELSDRALVLAGSSWLKAGDEQKGLATLDQAINSTSSFAVDAVHEKALWLIANNKNQDAFELTNEWASKLENHPLAVDVLLDRANASRNVPELADRSAQLYAEIATRYPKSKLAPGSLYQAAYSNYENENFDQAIAEAKQFEANYPGDKLLAGIREVKGDSLLMKGQQREAEAVFRELATDFQDEKADLSNWITRAGFASYLQGNYDETIQWLEEKDASITIPKDKAESMYWIGSSYFQKQNYDKASEKLEQSLDIDSKWSRAPEVMLALCNSQLKQSKFDDAELTANKLMKAYPDNPEENVSRALYAVGDESMAAKEFPRAIRSFDVLSKNYPKSELASFADYRAAYAAVEEGDGENAAKRFGDFLKNHPKHELAQQATLGRTNALRMSGNSSESIAELKKLVKNASDEDTRNKANYQLGLAYVDDSDWKNAVSTFEGMTKSLAADAPNADRVWYELAWAQRENGAADDSLKSFAALLKNYPDSSTAPEAHFLLASQSYADKDYDKAIKQYAAADVETARSEIREKARYKLGWCHYKKGDFTDAVKTFQSQADSFPEGSLYADGRYMIAQSAWRANNYEKAYEAYTVAKPVIEEAAKTDQRVKKYTTPMLLNGARAGIKTNHFDEAAAMAKELAEMPDVNDATKQQASLELGLAKMSLGDIDAASKAFTIASADSGETGAHAKSLMGDILFKQATDAAKAGDEETSKKKFNEAIEAYGEVYYGYGGSLASAEVKSWQAYAAYEAARCYTVQINLAKDIDKVMLIGKAIDRYEYLKNRFPDHKLAGEAKRQITKLTAIKDKLAGGR